jgi:hypothetical protein
MEITSPAARPAPKGPVGAACLLSLSVLLWIAVPFVWAARRLGKADL